jgi:hypothetical protein
VAARERSRILAQAIPAVTNPMGSNSLRILSGNNFNMNDDANRPNYWPTLDSEGGMIGWHHSDIKDVSYNYVYMTFFQIMEQGGLR